MSEFKNKGQKKGRNDVVLGNEKFVDVYAPAQYDVLDDEANAQKRARNVPSDPPKIKK